MSAARVKTPATGGGALYGLQLPFLWLLLFGDLLFGMPLATGLLGADILFDPTRALLASSLIIGIVSLSILVMMVGGQQTSQAE